MNFIINPITKEKFSIFSYTGKQILRKYIRTYKKQYGGSRRRRAWDGPRPLRGNMTGQDRHTLLEQLETAANADRLSTTREYDTGIQGDNDNDQPTHRQLKKAEVLGPGGKAQQVFAALKQVAHRDNDVGITNRGNGSFVIRTRSYAVGGIGLQASDTELETAAFVVSRRRGNGFTLVHVAPPNRVRPDVDTVWWTAKPVVVHVPTEPEELTPAERNLLEMQKKRAAVAAANDQEFQKSKARRKAERAAQTSPPRTDLFGNKLPSQQQTTATSTAATSTAATSTAATAATAQPQQRRNWTLPKCSICNQTRAQCPLWNDCGR